MKIFWILIVFVLNSFPAYAYLDPGAITLFFQLIIAGVVGFLVYIKFYYSKFKDFIKKIFKYNKKQL